MSICLFYFISSMVNFVKDFLSGGIWWLFILLYLLELWKVEVEV